MNTALMVGGPLALALIGTFLVGSGIVYFGELPDGIEHQAGVEQGGTFVSVEQSADFSETAGLEIEEQSIEYRDGMETNTKIKQPGLTKYANIHIRRPVGIDTESWRFIFANQVARENCETCNVEENEEEGVEMHQIDPPVLVIPAR